MRDHPVALRGPRFAAAALLFLLLPAAAEAAPGLPQARSAAPAATVRERLARVVALEDARSFGDGWLPGRILDPDPEVRRQTVLALGRIGRPEAVEPLIAALGGDEAGAVRSTAAFALGIVEDPLPGEALAALETALSDPSGRVREKAIEALGRKGGERAGEIVRARLAELVETDGYGERREDVEASRRRTSWDEARLALFALARIRDEGGDPGDTLALLADGGSPRTHWWAAAWTAARLRDPTLISLHRAYAASDDPVVRALGVRGLGGAGLPVGGELIAPLDDPSDTVRIEAIRGLSALREAGHPVPEAAGALLFASLDDPLPALRAEALAGLAAARHEGAAPGLIARMQAPEPESRAGALRALHRQDDEGFWLLLSGWSDRDPQGRIALARHLSSIREPRIRDFLLRSLLRDDDAQVRTAALTGIGELEAELAAAGSGSPETVPALLGRLEASDVMERAAAARALGRLGEGLAEVRRAYREDAAGEPAFRLAALRAALAHGPQEVRSGFAREALADAAWPVRREAHAFLRRAASNPPEPEAAATLEPEEYAAMLEAPFTPVAWIETDAGEIEIELFIADAPRTAWNFMRLAREGFYDGQRFHRVVPNFVAQAGDPRGASPGGPGYTIRCEINERFYMRGSVGMALDGKDTGGSQFFITLLPQPHLNGRYTLFGQVRDGFEVLDRLRPQDRIRRLRIWDGITPPS